MGPTESREMTGATALDSVNPNIPLNSRAVLVPFAVWVIMTRYQTGYGTR